MNQRQYHYCVLRPLKNIAKRLSLAIFCGYLLSGCAPPGNVIEPDPDYAPVLANDPSQTVRSDNGAIYQPNTFIELFRNNRAYRVGDILTVVLEEKTDAVSRSATSTAKDNSLNLGAPSLFGLPITHDGNAILSAGVEASRNFSGSGNSSQSNSLEGNVTLMVTRVLSNGNLMISGEKVVSINQAAESIRLSGIIRPQDIRPDNTVLSSRVSNARVIYGGAGTLADANTKGWMSRFFNSRFWPF